MDICDGSCFPCQIWNDNAQLHTPWLSVVSGLPIHRSCFPLQGFQSIIQYPQMKWTEQAYLYPCESPARCCPLSLCYQRPQCICLSCLHVMLLCVHLFDNSHNQLFQNLNVSGHRIIQSWSICHPIFNSEQTSTSSLASPSNFSKHISWNSTMILSHLPLASWPCWICLLHTASTFHGQNPRSACSNILP